MKVEDQEKLLPTDKVYKFSDEVSFQVKYPAEYKKTKHLKDNEIIKLHPVQAENWQERGLGKIVK